MSWTKGRSISNISTDEDPFAFTSLPHHMSWTRSIRISKDENKELVSIQALERLYRKKTENMFDRIMKTRKRNEYNQRRLQSQNELDVTLHYSRSCPLLDQQLTTYNFDSIGSSRSHSFNALSVPTPSSPPSSSSTKK
jgi:hypothetical protein